MHVQNETARQHFFLITITGLLISTITLCYMTYRNWERNDYSIKTKIILPVNAIEAIRSEESEDIAQIVSSTILNEIPMLETTPKSETDATDTEATTEPNKDASVDTNNPTGETETETIPETTETVTEAVTEEKEPKPYVPATAEPDPDGSVLTAIGGVNYYFDQRETWYNMDMTFIVERAHRWGLEGEYWIRDDGCKMFGKYIIIAANLDTHPFKTLVPTSLGMGIVLDTGGFAKKHPYGIDIATNWKD